MSIVIKSNNVYSGSTAMAVLPQILTTRQAVMSGFIARVVADGGQVVSTSKIEKAVNFLFDNNLYGRMGVCASPHYAVKLDANGGVMKLYSIDGQDLIGLTVGGGTLPKIVSNFVDFNDGVSADTVGGILTTATKQKWSETGRIAVAVATKEHKNTQYTPVFGMTTHGDDSLNSDVFSLLTNLTNSGAVGRILTGAYNSSTFNNIYVFTINNAANGCLLYQYNNLDKYAALLVHGITQSITNSVVANSDIFNKEYYLDFGGVKRAASNLVSGVKVSAMWFMKDVNDAQASEINKFHESEYL